MTPLSAFPFHETRPRLLCRAVRHWCAIVGEHRSRHAASCPNCRSYFEARNKLDQALRRDALVAGADPLVADRDFEREILRAVRSFTPNRERAIPIGVWLGGGLGAVAAFVAFLAVSNPDRLRKGGLAETSTAEETAVILNTVETLSTQFVESVIPAAGGLASQNPLQRELGSVYSDVRSALDFLALNFLPTARIEAPPQPARRI